MKPFLKRVDECLAEAGKKRPWLAERTGISLGTINSWYHGDRSPRVEDAFKVAEAFLLPVEYFITGRKQVLQINYRTIIDIISSLARDVLKDFSFQESIAIIRFGSKMLDRLSPALVKKGDEDLGEKLEALSKTLTLDAENGQKFVNFVDVLSSGQLIERFGKRVQKEFSKEQRIIISRAFFMLMKIITEEAEKESKSIGKNMDEIIASMETHQIVIRGDESQEK